MPRLKNTKTGAVVSVTNEKAARLGTEWEPAEKPAPKRTTKKAADKPSDD